MREQLLIVSLLLLASFSFANANTIKGALETCLRPRCEQGEKDDSKFPNYNYGISHVCDGARWNSYYYCRYRKPFPGIGPCNEEANGVKKACKADPCAYVAKACLDYPCKRTTNSYDCWYKGKFGYWDYRKATEKRKKNGEWAFFVIEEPGIPTGAWKKVCDGRKERCAASLVAKAGETVPPIHSELSSVACVGHNCHHAASDAGKCLLKAGVKDVRVVVFDDEDMKSRNFSWSAPTPAGNVQHSMLTLPHPSESGKRCLVEAIVSCGKKGAAEEGCCYAAPKSGGIARDDFSQLENTKCSFMRFGPLNEKWEIKGFTTYDPEKFLDERGTLPATFPEAEIERVETNKTPVERSRPRAVEREMTRPSRSAH